MLLFIALTSSATVALALMALSLRPPSPVRVRAWQLAGGSDAPVGPAEQTFAGRIVRPVAKRLLQSLPNRWLRRLDRTLVAAGEPVDPGLFVLLSVIIALGSWGFGATHFGLRGTLLCGAIGTAAPWYWLRRKAQRRRRQIVNALPDAIDLLVTCVEAGLGLDAALVRVGEMMEGPLGFEIQRTLRQIAVGRPRHEALLDLGARPGVPDLDGVIRPIVQAERSGVSIGTALRVQAESLRVRRRYRAQETAHKIPAKMVIVIAVFFLPAVMIVALTPAVISVIKVFSDTAIF